MVREPETEPAATVQRTDKTLGTTGKRETISDEANVGHRDFYAGVVNGLQV